MYSPHILIASVTPVEIPTQLAREDLCLTCISNADLFRQKSFKSNNIYDEKNRRCSYPHCESNIRRNSYFLRIKSSPIFWFLFESSEKAMCPIFLESRRFLFRVRFFRFSLSCLVNFIALDSIYFCYRLSILCNPYMFRWSM